jgi:hypothetical protein
MAAITTTITAPTPIPTAERSAVEVPMNEIELVSGKPPRTLTRCGFVDADGSQCVRRTYNAVTHMCFRHAKRGGAEEAKSSEPRTKKTTNVTWQFDRITGVLSAWCAGAAKPLTVINCAVLDPSE